MILKSQTFQRKDKFDLTRVIDSIDTTRNNGNEKILKDFFVVDKKHINDGFNLKQLNSLYKIEKIAHSIFTHAQSGEYDISCQVFQEGMELISRIHYRRLNLLLKITLISPRAYYFYKLKEYNTAFEVTLDAITMIDNYEYRYKYSSLHCKKIEQLYNLCRIFVKSNQQQQYIDASFQVYNYLLSGIKPRYGKNWGSSFLEKIPLVVTDNILLSFYYETLQTSSIFLENDLKDIFFTKLQKLIKDNSPHLFV